MIKKSFLVFFILFVLHALVVKLFPSVGMATHQRQDNIVKAQQAFYAEHIDKAIVGTSLANRIIRDSIPDIQSVAFVGCSVEDGLRILSARSNVPKYVFVETNLFLRDGNKELISKVTEGLITKIKQWIPSLREQYEPICMLASTLIGASKINPQAGMAVVNMEWLNRSIEDKIKTDMEIPDSTVRQRMPILKSLIHSLEVRGTKFVFFEMPINKKLLYLKQNNQMREIVRREFSMDKYVYLPSDTTEYLTTDGMHMDYEGQQRYTHFFKDAVTEFLSTGDAQASALQPENK